MALSDYMALFPPSSLTMPRFSALAAAVLQQAADLQALIPFLESGFSIGAAVGVQLDALGASVGVPRPPGMTDEDYRQLLSMKFALWGWDGSNETVPELVGRMIPGASQIDNGDLSVTVTVPDSVTLPAEPEELFPVPAGVQIHTS